MHSLVWKDSMSVGIAQMDADHRRIADLFGRLHDALTLEDMNTACRLVGELVSEARGHFEREDAMLRRFDYPRLSTHLHEHDVAVGRLRRLQDVVRKRAGEAALQMLEDLSAFFLNRLFVIDMDYKWFLRDRGIGRSAGGAPALAGQGYRPRA